MIKHKLDSEIKQEFEDSVLMEELSIDDLPEEFRDSFMFEEKKTDFQPTDFWSDTDFDPLD